MLRTLFQAFLLIALITASHAQNSRMTPLPAALVQSGQLVDAKNGFTIRLIQPSMTWSVVDGLGADFSKYVGVDAEKRIVYTIFIDRRRYADQTEDGATKYADGIRVGLRQGGWQVSSSKFSPSKLPRNGSYRFLNEATHPNGAKAVFVEYVTSPDKLYSLGAVLPAGTDEREFLAFIQTFQILK